MPLRSHRHGLSRFLRRKSALKTNAALWLGRRRIAHGVGKAATPRPSKPFVSRVRAPPTPPIPARCQRWPVRNNVSRPLTQAMTTFPSIAPTIAKLLRLLASDQPGEIIASVHALQRVLSSAELHFHDLANAIEFVARREVPQIASTATSDDNMSE